MLIIWPKCVWNDFIKMRTLIKCITMISLLFAENIAIYTKFCKVQLGEGGNAIFKKVGQHLQNDSYLNSNSPYTIKLASKL